MGAHSDKGPETPSQPPHLTALTCGLAMTGKSQRPEGQDRVLSALNVAIDSLNLAKEVASITPAKTIFGSVAILLAMIRVGPLLFYGKNFKFTHLQDTMVNEQDYVDLGLACADICKALERGMGEKKLDDLSKSVCDAINQLTT